MSRQLAEKILDMAASRAAAAEVIVQQGESTSVQFENNRLKYVTSKGVTGAGVRVIHRGRIGFSSTTDLSEPEQVVTDALESASFGQEAKLEFQGPASYEHPVIHHPKVVDFPPQRAIEICRGAIGHLLEYDDHLDCAAGMDKAVNRTWLANTSGLSLELETTSFDAGVYALRVEQDESLTGVEESKASRRLFTDPRPLLEKAVRKLEYAKKTARPKHAKIPVVLAPEALGVIVASLSANTNGKNHQKGTSRLIGRLGEQVLDESVTIRDDSLVDYRPGSVPFDGEGTPTRRFPLFENGIFTNFIYDRQTAATVGARPTGNASRSFASQPVPGHGNIRMTPGNRRLADILADLDHALLVYQVLGGGQSNVLTGEFSVNVELGYVVEKGRIAGRVKDVMLAGNAFDAFNNVAAISSETEWHGSVEFPHVCFDALSVVSSQR